MTENNLKKRITEVLKTDDRVWTVGADDKKELNQTSLLSLVEKIDENIIQLLLEDDNIRNKFFVKIKDVYVFKTNNFVFFMEENKVNNMYTQYKNKIGLTDGKRFIDDSKDVVLNWPFKDCILEGGQSTEEGMDSYFQWQETTMKDKIDDEGNKIKDGRKNIKEVDIEGHYEQKQAKRKEIFFNEIIAADEIDRLEEPKAFVNWKRHTTKGEEAVTELKRGEEGTIKENLIIKGNNLLALHSLKKEFTGKVKLIYIDPPYNTGVDSFKYNDQFNHSTWLTFMHNRLLIAKELLNVDGVIFVQCDNNEFSHLKVLMDEIFIDSFETLITCKVKGPSGVAAGSQFIFDTNEYILVYKKNSNTPLSKGYKVDKEIIKENSKTIENYYHILENIDLNKKKLINEIDGGDGKIKIYKYEKGAFKIRTLKKIERIEKEYVTNFEKIFRLQTMSGGTEKRVLKNISDNEFYSFVYKPIKGKNAGVKIENLIFKRSAVSFLKDVAYLKDDITPIRQEYVTNMWAEGWWQGITSEGGVSLKNGKKPEKLLQRILDLSTKKGDIVLDFHLGSGTTAAVAHKMNRQYIGIEQLDYAENDSTVRIQNVINGDTTGISKVVNWKGGGDFIYCELAKWNQSAKEKINEFTSLDKLIEFFDTLYDKYFLNYNLKIKEFKEKVILEDNFKNLSLEEQKSMFLSMLDLNQMYINESEMEDTKYNLSVVDIALTKKFYNKED